MQPELIKNILRKSGREFGATEQRVLEDAKERKLVSTNADEDFAASATYGDRLADSIARIGGSWGFIIAFFLFLAFWAAVNTLILTRSTAFDPYPFIFLNLVLSMIAAIQAPIIMMSQNRQSERDRFFAAKDYEVNLKAEIEVLGLHHKIDMAVLTELKELKADVAKLTEELRAARGAQ